jgi:hypothetical protein
MPAGDDSPNALTIATTVTTRTVPRAALPSFPAWATLITIDELSPPKAART